MSQDKNCNLRGTPPTDADVVQNSRTGKPVKIDIKEKPATPPPAPPKPKKD